MNRIDRVLKAWCERHPVRNPPASRRQLGVLSSLLFMDLPADVAAFYEMNNGVPEDAYDEHFVAFWSIEKILRESTEWTWARGLCFADFLYNSWCFEFVVDTRDLRVRCGDGGEIANSLTDFLEQYLDRPETLPIL
jgi:hypothetical protein